MTATGRRDLAQQPAAVTNSGGRHLSLNSSLSPSQNPRTTQKPSLSVHRWSTATNGNQKQEGDPLEQQPSDPATQQVHLPSGGGASQPLLPIVEPWWFLCRFLVFLQ